MTVILIRNHNIYPESLEINTFFISVRGILDWNWIFYLISTVINFCLLFGFFMWFPYLILLLYYKCIKLRFKPITASSWYGFRPSILETSVFMNTMQAKSSLSVPSSLVFKDSDSATSICIVLHFTKALLWVWMDLKTGICHSAPHIMLPGKRQCLPGRRHPSYWPLGGMQLTKLRTTEGCLRPIFTNPKLMSSVLPLGFLHSVQVSVYLDPILVL